jgi:HEPN/Toprim N-terminal domain 1
MGSWGSFFVGKYEFETTKSYANEALMVVFRDTDRVIGIDDQGYKTVVYETTVAIAKVRLEILGFTLDQGKRIYEEHKHSRRDFDNWIENVYELSNEDDSNEILDILISVFPECDVRLLLRVFIEGFPDNDRIWQDLSDFVGGGYYDTLEDICLNYTLNTAKEAEIASPMIILTEGTSDRSVISRSIQALHPHLADYYRFFDFEGTNQQGGVGTVVALLRGFIGAGISNRVIALVDNDTAAHDAITALLQNTTIPDNFRIVHYPSISLLNSYPTIGPTGAATVNVNGVAGGLELYFGLDVLNDDAQNLPPVHWTGWNQKLKKYQGEVIGKSALQKRFWGKIEALEQGKGHAEADWTGIEAILDVLFAAFHENG